MGKDIINFIMIKKYKYRSFPKFCNGFRMNIQTKIKLNGLESIKN
jgi:hypothetical protein